MCARLTCSQPTSVQDIVLVGQHQHGLAVKARLDFLKELFRHDVSHGEYTLERPHVDMLWEACVKKYACPPATDDVRSTCTSCYVY
jgi:hypothetical protein